MFLSLPEKWHCLVLLYFNDAVADRHTVAQYADGETSAFFQAHDGRLVRSVARERRGW
jgi:hypothetical protein